MLTKSAILRLRDPQNNRLVVALSGGVDSCVLLDLVVKMVAEQDVKLGIKQGGPEVCALHINHGLHEEADETSSFCRSIAQDHDIAITVVDVQVSQQGSLEGNAREARYEAFEGFLQADDLLLLGHHADDQAETVLFKLFRGSRVVGLQGMPVERRIGSGRLYRPLLGHNREEIQSYAQGQSLAWRDDPTNSGIKPDRNFIRHELFPMIDSRFPGARKAVLSGMARDQSVREGLYTASVAILDSVRYSSDCLELSLLKKLDPEPLGDVLRAWLQEADVPQVSGNMLRDLADAVRTGQLISMTTAHIEFRETRSRLYLLRPLPEMQHREFELQDRTTIPGGLIANLLVKGRGLKSTGLYRVSFRQGGEQMRVRRLRSLKNLFQEIDLPSWLRDRVPLIFAGQELVAVGGVPDWDIPMLVADGWQADTEGEGCQITVHLEDRITGAD
jgi:tRNA(Ile)-lysidine synthase